MYPSYNCHADSEIFLGVPLGKDLIPEDIRAAKLKSAIAHAQSSKQISARKY